MTRNPNRLVEKLACSIFIEHGVQQVYLNELRVCLAAARPFYRLETIQRTANTRAKSALPFLKPYKGMLTTCGRFVYEGKHIFM